MLSVVIFMALTGTTSGKASPKSTGVVCFHLFSIILIFVSSILLVTLGSVYASRIRVLFYVQSTCRVAMSIYSIQYACVCGYKCRSLYPCYTVYVRGNWSDRPNNVDTIPLYIDDIHLAHLICFQN